MERNESVIPAEQGNALPIKPGRVRFKIISRICGTETNCAVILDVPAENPQEFGMREFLKKCGDMTLTELCEMYQNTGNW